MKVNEVGLSYQAVPFGLDGHAYLRKLLNGRSFYLHDASSRPVYLSHGEAAGCAHAMQQAAERGRPDHGFLLDGDHWVEEKPTIQAAKRVFANMYTALTTRRTDDSAQQGCYPGCFYYTGSCYRQPCRKHN